MTNILDALLHGDVPTSLLAPRDGPALAARQADVLAFVCGYIDREGVPPGHRDVSERFGWSSTNAAREFFLALERKGYLERTPKRSRGIRVTDLGRRWWACQRRAAS